jgi:hypothetical protein
MENEKKEEDNAPILSKTSVPKGAPLTKPV